MARVAVTSQGEPRQGALVGFMIFTRNQVNDGVEWRDDWDGKIHSTHRDALVEARRAAEMCRNVIVVRCRVADLIEKADT